MTWLTKIVSQLLNVNETRSDILISTVGPRLFFHVSEVYNGEKHVRWADIVKYTYLSFHFGSEER